MMEMRTVTVIGIVVEMGMEMGWRWLVWHFKFQSNLTKSSIPILLFAAVSFCNASSSCSSS